MAILEIEAAAEEQTWAQREAQQEGFSFSEWTKRRLFGSLPPVTFTTDDGEVYEIPDLPADLSRATARASEAALAEFWDTL